MERAARAGAPRQFGVAQVIHQTLVTSKSFEKF